VLGRAAAGLIVFAVVAGSAAAAPPTPLANRCVEIGAAGRFYLKPTRLGAYLLYDRGRKLLSTGQGASVERADAPDASSEWSFRRRADGRYTIRSTATKRFLRVRGRALVTGSSGTRFRLKRARGCRPYPEAALGASGKPFRGLRGFVDPHVHIPAALRAGGLVISGDNFNPFGIPDALGHDADVHGSDGSLDVTGNLLRSGEPAGTHDTHGWPTFAGWPTFDTYTHQQIYYR
jgi:hypothetical protein